ncbi:MAG: RAD55 family ATPase [Pseudomonadota bacterium]
MPSPGNFAASADPPPDLMATGVPGVDEVLGGGLVAQGLYLVEGKAGAGKTIFAMQTAFHRARRGDRVVYVSLIAESHGKMLRHLQGLDFFDERRIGDEITLISGYRALVEEGLDGLVAFVAQLLRDCRADLLVLDGFRSVRHVDSARLSLPKFLYELNALITAESCTGMLLSPPAGVEPQPEHTLVDGLIELTRYSSGLRGVREFEVHKMRGAEHMQGRHVLRISTAGMHVFPRLEAVMHATFQPFELYSGKLGFGEETLDDMLNGGFVEGSTTTVLGAPGSGKTLLGLKFLEGGLARGESALYFGFYESPARLIRKAASVGIELQAAVDDGRLEVLWQPPLEFYMDELAERLLDALERRPEVSRLLVDGVEGFTNDRIHPERSADFLAALSTRLRMRRLTTVLTEEMQLFGETIGLNTFRFSATVENIILLRYVEIRSRVHRLISVMKLRDSDYDHSIREFEVHGRGITVASTFDYGEAVLTGRPRVGPGIGGGAVPPTETGGE